MQTEVKKEIKEKKEETEKYDYYMPMNDPKSNKAYQLIKGVEKEILTLVAFSDQTAPLRDYMRELRHSIRKNVCFDCVKLGKTTSTPIGTPVQVLVKDDVLSSAHDKLVLIQEWSESTKQRHTMDCEGCRALKCKQIATGYIKNRRFKQI